MVGHWKGRIKDWDVVNEALDDDGNLRDSVFLQKLGGGYIAQRIFSAKDERHGLLSVLWFNIAHYALRPWPWILTGLAVIVLYPGLQQPETGYMMVVTDYVPHAFIGIIILVRPGSA